jgi:tetratricopeptide (TPR) repeat protein
MRGPSTPAADEMAVLTESNLASAETLIQSGDCARALSDHIEVVLAGDPDNLRALELKNRAEVCGAPPPVDPPPSGLTPEAVRAHLQSALPLIEAGNCLVALNDHLNVVLESEPTNAEALALKARADACQAPPPLPPPPQEQAPALARRVPPEAGGLELLPNELQRDYDNRRKAMRSRYDEAQSALSNGAFQRADVLLTGILREAGDRYLDAGKLLLQAKNGLKDLAMRIYGGASELEKREEWDKAIQEYQRARDTDPVNFTTVDADIKRVTDKKTAIGVKRCDEGNANWLLKRNSQALQAYEEVLKLVPADHKCYVLAKERVAILRK